MAEKGPFRGGSSKGGMEIEGSAACCAFFCCPRAMQAPAVVRLQLLPWAWHATGPQERDKLPTTRHSTPQGWHKDLHLSVTLPACGYSAMDCASDLENLASIKTSCQKDRRGASCIWHSVPDVMDRISSSTQGSRLPAAEAVRPCRASQLHAYRNQNSFRVLNLMSIPVDLNSVSAARKSCILHVLQSRSKIHVMWGVFSFPRFQS
ncbi:hypothetical protein EJ07DRAFT_159817 [Lizonia empirigonia]|nr:hypothetical protein EJ07DRAFT_159817 [Lizonia empirigonia]